jgi:hypothetical protein
MPPLIQWVFVLFGAWLIYLNVQSLLAKRKALRQAQEAASWPAVPGRVVTAQITEGRYRDTKTGNMIHTYRPEVTYNYTAEGKERLGSRLAFGKILYYQPAEAEAFMQAHGLGAAVQVYHDPLAPDESVLDRDPAHATKLVIADAFMLIVGLALFGTGLGAMLT